MKGLHDLAATQWGLVSRRQLLEAGWTTRRIEGALTDGRLLPTHRGVYRAAGSVDCTNQRLLAGCLACEPAWASHRSGGVLWGLARVSAPQPEVLVVGSARRRPSGLLVHRTNFFDPADATEVHGIPCTSLARTVLDLGAVYPMERVESAMEDAVVRLGTQFSALRDCLDRLAARGRNGCGVLRTLLDARDPTMAAPQSELELAIIRVIRRAGLPEPVRQHWLQRPGAPPICLDLAWPDYRFGIEADSRVWHAGRLDVQRNSEKHNTLAVLGWRVLRYTWFDVRVRRHVIPAEVHRFVAA